MTVMKASLGLALLLLAGCTQPNAIDYMLGSAPSQQRANAYQQGRQDQVQQERWQHGYPVYQRGY